jgi:hypothetical protein
LREEQNAGGQQSADTADLIDPALIDQNVKTSICRHKLALSALWDSRQ